MLRMTQCVGLITPVRVSVTWGDNVTIVIEKVFKVFGCRF